MPTFITNTRQPEFAALEGRKSSDKNYLRQMLFGAGLSSTTGNPIFWAPQTFAPSTNNAGTAATIDQDNNNISLDIDSEATTADIINISAATLTTGKALDIPDADLLTTGKILNLVSNAPDTSSRTLLYVENTNTAAVGAQVAEFRQAAATAPAVRINMVGAGAVGAILDLKQASASPANADVHARIRFIANDAAGTEIVDQRIDAVVATAASGDFSTKFIFYTSSANTGNEAMRLLSEGQIQVDVASAIAGTTGTADVFDDYDDVGIIKTWNASPVSRAEFANKMVELGIWERKSSGSGYLMGIQKSIFLAYGAVGQLADRIRSLEERLGVNPPLRLIEV